VKARRNRPGWLSLLLAVLATPLARAEPAMWVIRDNDSTIYLVGTVHALRPEMLWNSEKIMKAVGESTELWLELVDGDNQELAAPLIQKYGIDAAKPLSKKLTFDERAKLAKVAEQYGIAAATLEPLKPWAVALMLTVLQIQKAGYDPKAGVDRLLRAQAEKEGDKVVGLETMEEQIRLFADLPDREQAAFLDQTLDQAAEGIELLDRIAKAWSEGDMDLIAEVFSGEMKKEAPNIYQKLIVDRNVRWAGQVEEILRGSGIHQIAVGAGHLAGPDSLQAQLEKRGIKVERF
jgi:uncharacterized protein